MSLLLCSLEWNDPRQKTTILWGKVYVIHTARKQPDFTVKNLENEKKLLMIIEKKYRKKQQQQQQYK